MFLFLVLFLAARMHPVQGPIGQMTEQDRAAAFTRVYGASLEDRMLWWSSLFFGTPYHLDPLGEGPKGRYDRDPLITYNRADCLSYVQMVMAFSLADGPGQVLPWLLHIRYAKGVPRFSNRYYTMAKGWIGAMARLEILQDVTRTLGGDAVETAAINLDHQTAWSRSVLKRFRILGPLAPSGTATIDYLRIGALEGLAHHMPRIVIAYIVRQPVLSSPYLVSHTGFIVRRAGHLWFRHASRTPGRRQVEERPFAEYAEGLVRFVGRRGWRPVLGMSLSRLRRPPVGPGHLLSGGERSP